MKNIIQEQKDWISSGKIGCVFASALVKQADKIGWKFYGFEEATAYTADIEIKKVNIVSIMFPGHSIIKVREWALFNNMFIETIDQMHEGLRIKLADGNISWVQYFGPDSHVKTRQAPYPMLTFAVKVPAHVYGKTMIKGIVHLAHASIEFISSKKCDTLWERSFVKTKKELGHSPTIAEAAKTTFAI